MNGLRTKILNYIEDNARVSTDELAILIGEDKDAVEKEIALMEKENIISGYNTMINWDKVGVEKVTALIEVRVTPQRGMGFDNVAKMIYEYPEVDSVYLISGGFDLMVTIEGMTLKEVASFVSDKLSPMESVLSTKTNFILKRYKDHRIIMTEEKEDEREMVSF